MGKKWYGHNSISRVVPSDVGMTRHATAAQVLCKGHVSRLATSPAFHFRSVQLVIMASPLRAWYVPLRRRECGAFRARAGGANAIMAPSYAAG
jgi:hypothetical protein